MLDNLREDWVTYERDIWRQGLWAMAVYRFGRWRYRFRHRMVRAPLSLIYKLSFKFIQIVAGIELPCEVNIGRRFRIDHFGGVIISGDVVFGDDVVIRNGVTIGLRRAGVRGSPKIGNRVDIGAGAKILGPITIGDDSTIGANAVVLQDVPPDSVAIGIPARSIPQRPATGVRRAENEQKFLTHDHSDILENGLLMSSFSGTSAFSATEVRPVLSVVAIGRNEGERLVRCLESIRQTRPLQGPIEVIYVDSGSTDGSLERAVQFKVKVKRLESANPCAAAARNAGWRVAKAPIIFFLDGDTVLERNFVADSIAELNDPNVAVVLGNRREISPKASIYNRVLDLDWISPAGTVEFCGGDALIRRDVLERVGGFDERLIAGEEPEMCQRIRTLGFTIKRVDRPMTGHDLAMTRFSQYWRRAVRSGYAYAEVSTRFRNTDLPLWDKKASRNLVHGAGLLGIIIGAPLGSIAFHSVIPFAAAVVIILVLAIRTAIRFRWKTADLATLLLFGLHSHLVQIPLLFGQLKYQRDRFTGKTAELIEYKHAAPG